MGILDELMNQKIIISMSDLEGNVLEGHSTMSVGWLAMGGVCLAANLKNVIKK
jgi:hypothetical protein